jgi:indolepyruvate ferredoxin oxidoreductase alpha subunit
VRFSHEIREEFEVTEAPSGGKTRQALLGNEACARGAYEAGVRLAIGYPGTPTTAALAYLLDRHKHELRAEWAINEKVALEVAAGHSWAGKRSFVALKMSGLNVAADSLLSVAASGTRGGLVVLVGDDPGVHYGMVEQDSRLYARLAVLPMVEPATPDEAKELTREAFEVSEASEAPVLVRLTTTTAGTFGPVTFSEPLRLERAATLPDDLARYTKAGSEACRSQHADALARMEKAAALFDRWNVYAPGSSRLGIIAGGSVWPYLQECLGRRSGGKFHTLRVTVAHPAPEDKIRTLLSQCDRVLVLEELETVIEDAARALAARGGPEILGKREGLLSEVGDFDLDLVEQAFSALEGKSPQPHERGMESDLAAWAPRTPTFCAGCPHRSTYAALHAAIRQLGHDPKDVLVAGDIGCTILGMNPPYSLCRTEVAMGASIALAQGFAYAGVATPVVAAIGDSTFLHAGIPALINAASRQVNLTVIVMDNRCAAMTGFQATPSSDTAGDDVVPNPVDLAELSRAAKVRRVRRILPYFHRRLARSLVEAMTSPGVNVVIAEAPCVARRRPLAPGPFSVVEGRCRGLDGCRPSCVGATGCPAIERREDGTARIAPDRCLGCGLCASICPEKAISRGLFGLWRRRR